MRDYRQKMDGLRLDRKRYKELRAYCSVWPEAPIIMEALGCVADSGLGPWLYRHVTRMDYSWTQLELEGLPCNRDTFRYYRAMFYWQLDKLVIEAEKSGRLFSDFTSL